MCQQSSKLAVSNQEAASIETAELLRKASLMPTHFPLCFKNKILASMKFSSNPIFSKGSEILLVSFNFLLEERWNYEQHLIYTSNASYINKYIYNCGNYILSICKKIRGIFAWEEVNLSINQLFLGISLFFMPRALAHFTSIRCMILWS